MKQLQLDDTYTPMPTPGKDGHFSERAVLYYVFWVLMRSRESLKWKHYLESIKVNIMIYCLTMSCQLSRSSNDEAIGRKKKAPSPTTNTHIPAFSAI